MRNLFTCIKFTILSTIITNDALLVAALNYPTHESGVSKFEREAADLISSYNLKIEREFTTFDGDGNTVMYLSGKPSQSAVSTFRDCRMNGVILNVTPGSMKVNATFNPSK